MVLLGDDAAQFQSVESVKELIETVYLLIGCGFSHGHTAAISFSDSFFRSFGQTLHGRHGVERVVNLLPIDWEIAFCTEVAVAEHLHRQVTELDIETELVAQFPCQFVEHHAEDLFPVHVRLVLALAIDSALHIQKRRDPSLTPADGG